MKTLLDPFFGEFGGMFVPQILMPSLMELEKAFVDCKDDPKFKEEFSISQIDLISSHGHTIFHNPKKKITLQIGNGYIINKNTKLKVICDFRTQDIKHNGQGAPLVPIGDLDLFSNYKFWHN